MEGLSPGDPQRVGRYRLLRRLGSGGMGQVYLGQSPSGRPVAVKIIRPELADNADFRQRFRQEVKAARRVSGMFTAPVVDADPDAPQPWMVTAFVSGPSLADAVASRGPLSVRAVRILAGGLAEGLGDVHAAGLVHRDLKPSNVLLASDGPRIIDFGISRSTGTAGPTRAGAVIGSPGFMSPEQAKGEPVGPASDIFSLGGVLAYAATGEPPFGEGPPSVLLYRVVHEDPSIGKVPAELRPLIERCLVRDPAGRPSTDHLLSELGASVPSADWLDRAAPASAAAGSPLRHTPLSRAPIGPSDGAGWPAADGAMAGVAADVAESGTVAGRAGSGRTANSGRAGVAAEALASVPAPAGAVSSVPASAAAAPASWPVALPADPAGDPLADSGRGSPPDGYADLVAPPMSHSGGRARRWRAGLAAACIVAVVIAGTVALALLPRHEPGRPGGSAAADSPPTTAVRHTSGRHPALSPASPAQAPHAGASDAADGSASPGVSAPADSASVVAPATVVLDYFAAVNARNWDLAWALGGDNLYASLTALVADNVGVSHDDVTVLGVSGDTVVARIRTTSVIGIIATHVQTFVVQNGVIVSRGPAPSG